jgi:hypothetical protein
VKEPAHDVGGPRLVATVTDPMATSSGCFRTDEWDGEALLVATPTDSPSGRILAATRTVRLGWATPATCP